MCCESSDVVRFDLGPLLEGQMRIAFRTKPSRTNNKRVISTFKFGYPRFTMKEGPKVKSDTPKVLKTHLLLVHDVSDGKPSYRNSWAGNLLVWSDLTLGPSYKVK